MVDKRPNGMLDPAPGVLAREIANRNKHRSPLLRLPGEIRNHIFVYALGGLHIVVSELKKKSYEIKKIRCAKMRDLTQKMEDGLRFTYFQPHYLSLLLVCRQIYAETALLPFSINHFWIKSEKALENWKDFNHVLPAQINAIEICQFWVYMTKSVLALSTLPAIKKVYVMSWSGMEFLDYQWVQVMPAGGVESNGDQCQIRRWDRFEKEWLTEFVPRDDIVENENSRANVQRRIKEVAGHGVEVVFIYGEFPYGRKVGNDVAS
ncbi:hypothetical protein BDV96DRAFT_569693 [Lophiotrema nucula]|uniref:DUF7730 domain-containing protein n=1 Tax=Lophiotrema nucula TaxID=690887 RepID=A0A6A5ZJ81_9PLEO|nr:hypothetical protein BDV96DRAFT_569693 [Lophiotrema nucula]